MTRRVPLHIIARLKRAIRAAELRQADFGDNDEYVKGKAKPYMDSWILPELKAALDWAEGK